MDRKGLEIRSSLLSTVFSAPVGTWFEETFPQGATPVQELAWPSIASAENVLQIAPTGTGKTLAAFLAIIDRLFRSDQDQALASGVRCVYVSPLRSLNYDIERNLRWPLDGICRRIGRDDDCPVQVGVRTGDTSAYTRRLMREHPPHILITTPESLSLLLSQEAWRPMWRGLDHIIIDEIHALAPTKRGADLAVSLERLASYCASDPIRIGLSATCAQAEKVARFLAGQTRSCRVITAPPPPGTPPIQISVESLISAGEEPHRGLSYRRLLKCLRRSINDNRTTVIFANTRALAEKLTHDLRKEPSLQSSPEPVVVAHHSALDANRRRETESALREGKIRAVVTSTSLELGVDIGTADLTIQIGSPGGVARCLQRVGRAGHRRGAQSRGLLVAATPAELAGAAVTAQAARAGRVEPLGMVRAPLDVLCQQLIGMACIGDQCGNEAFDLIRNALPMAELRRADFDACIDFLAGKLDTPAGAVEAEDGAGIRWSSPRLWSRDGYFGLRSQRVAQWFRNNVGTILSEETVRVIERGVAIGTLEVAYAERLVPGDRFVLDGRALEFYRLERSTLITRPTAGEPALPRWTSTRQSLSFELAQELARFRSEAGDRLVNDGPSVLRSWLARVMQLDERASGVLVELFEAQVQWSEIPSEAELFVERSPSPSGPGSIYTFHAPLHRAACEALGRAVAARLGQQIGRDLTLRVADLGWSIRTGNEDEASFSVESIRSLFSIEGFADAVLQGVDRGELPARRFRHVASTALMVLRNPEPGRRVRVGGLNWVSTRLYPLVKSACPDHPLLRETRREVLEDVLDVPAATRWLAEPRQIRVRDLPALSPFAAAWIEQGEPDILRFESPEAALRRLHARLVHRRHEAIR
jgi:ATP-dependent helicase Lhr and Lhr-like helicase